MKKLFLSMLVLALASMSLGGAFAQESGGTLRAAFQNDWESLDPHVTSSYSSLQILNNVLETLTTFDDNLELVPS